MNLKNARWLMAIAVIAATQARPLTQPVRSPDPEDDSVLRSVSTSLQRAAMPAKVSPKKASSSVLRSETEEEAGVGKVPAIFRR